MKSFQDIANSITEESNNEPRKDKYAIAESYHTARFWFIEDVNFRGEEYKEWHKKELKIDRILVPLEIQMLISKMRETDHRKPFEFPLWDKSLREYRDFSNECVQNLKYQIGELIGKMKFTIGESEIKIWQRIDDYLKDNKMDIVWKQTKSKLSRKVPKMEKDFTQTETGE